VLPVRRCPDTPYHSGVAEVDRLLSLLDRYAPEKFEEHLAFFCGEAFLEGRVDLASERASLLEPSTAPVRGDDEPGPSVVGVWLAADEILAGEVVDEGHHGARVDAQQLAELPLGPAALLRGDDEDGVVPAAHAEGLQGTVEVPDRAAAGSGE
jgi:hypothetical protein